MPSAVGRPRPKIASVSARRAAEHRLLIRLQDDHGYMFMEMPRAADRHTVHFSGSRKTGRYSLTTGRVMRVSVPTRSWLASEADAVLLKKTKTKTKTKMKNPGGA